MYPNFTKEDVWNLCLTMIEKDAPYPDLIKDLKQYKDDFYHIYFRIKEEHSHVKNKYYRTEGKEGIVNPLHLEHYSRLMYYFSRHLFLKQADKIILDQIFLSIKSKCAIDLFYEFDIKKYFMPFHAYASVLGRAEYGNYTIITQNCTIGNNYGKYPKLGDGLILSPGAIVLGSCRIGKNVQIAAGALVVDTDVADDTVVFGRVPNLDFRKNKRDNISMYFDIE